jgi:hypothetical protein
MKKIITILLLTVLCSLASGRVAEADPKAFESYGFYERIGMRENEKAAINAKLKETYDKYGVSVFMFALSGEGVEMKDFVQDFFKDGVAEYVDMGEIKYGVIFAWDEKTSDSYMAPFLNTDNRIMSAFSVEFINSALQSSFKSAASVFGAMNNLSEAIRKRADEYFGPNAQAKRSQAVLWRQEGPDGVELFGFNENGSFIAIISYKPGKGQNFNMQGKYALTDGQLVLSEVLLNGNPRDNLNFRFEQNGDVAILGDNTYYRVLEKDIQTVIANPLATYVPSERAPDGEFYTIGNDKISSIAKVVGQRNVVKSDFVMTDMLKLTVVYTTDPADHTQAANDIAKYFQHIMANDGFISLKAFNNLPYDGGVEMSFAKDSVDKGNIVIIDIDYNSKGYTLLFRKGRGSLTRN